MPETFTIPPHKGNNEEDSKKDNTSEDKGGKVIPYDKNRFGKPVSESKENLVDINRTLIGLDIVDVSETLSDILDSPISVDKKVRLLQKSNELSKLSGKINKNIYLDHIVEFENQELKDLVEIVLNMEFEELKIRPAYAVALFHTIFKKEQEEMASGLEDLDE